DLMNEHVVTSGQSATLESVKGLNIHYRSWRPEARPRGIVAIVPGFNSHSGYYTWVAGQFVAHGLAVYAVDLHGRGKSDGERFYTESFDDYVSDVRTMVTHARSRDPELPLYLLGHSAGGVVACLFTIEHPQDVAGFVCESFAFQVPAPDFALAVFK